MHLPVAERRTSLERLFTLAHAADIYRKRTGRAHRLWGNGTLYAAAFAGSPALPPRSNLSDARYLLALGDVLDALILWRTGRRSH